MLHFWREAGNHVRSFSNVRKSARSTALLKGVCYLCAAGRTNGPPFEDIRLTAAEWTKTCGPNNLLPWDDPSPLLHYLPVNDTDVAGFFKPDLFHVFHAGLGKDYAASCLVYLCKSIYKQRRIDTSLQLLNADFRQFLQDTKEKCNFRQFSFDMLGYESSRSYPKGHWSKNMDTATVCKFVEHACVKYVFDFLDDECIAVIIDACGAIHQFMTIVFTGSFFFNRTRGMANDFLRACLPAELCEAGPAVFQHELMPFCVETCDAYVCSHLAYSPATIPVVLYWGDQPLCRGNIHVRRLYRADSPYFKTGICPKARIGKSCIDTWFL